MQAEIIMLGTVGIVGIIAFCVMQYHKARMNPEFYNAVALQKEVDRQTKYHNNAQRKLEETRQELANLQKHGVPVKLKEEDMLDPDVPIEDQAVDFIESIIGALPDNVKPFLASKTLQAQAAEYLVQNKDQLWGSVKTFFAPEIRQDHAGQAPAQQAPAAAQRDPSGNPVYLPTAGQKPTAGQPSIQQVEESGGAFV